MANRVWTIERSSAKSSSTLSSAACTTGVPATAEMTSDGIAAGSESSARTTSVVVPEREIASTSS